MRRLAGTRRVGHCGTLDPFASGILPVAIGRGTRLVDEVHKFPKTYEADLHLGIETDTLDLEGTVMRLGLPPLKLTQQDVEECFERFRGVIQQVPPAFSAARVQGQRAYELARGGERVELAARTVYIHNLTLLALEKDRITFSVTCSSGTYVRSLGRDMTYALGTVGHLSRLVRTRVGPFSLHDALLPEELEALGDLGMVLLPPDAVFADSAAIALSALEAQRVRNGAPVPASDSLSEGATVRAYEGEELLALLRYGDTGLRPVWLLK